jgi:hypothetical protein
LPAHSTPRGKIGSRGWVIGQQLHDIAERYLADATRNFDDRPGAFHPATVQ